MSEDIRERLERDLAEVEWREIRPHVARDSVILVASELELLDVAVAVTEDDTDRVAVWIEAGQVGRPDAKDLERWEGDLEKMFRVLIAQPFLLVQETTGD